MLSLKKSPLHGFSKHSSADPPVLSKKSPNPYDSDDESDSKQTLPSSKNASSGPKLSAPHSNTNLSDDYNNLMSRGTKNSSKKYSYSYEQRNRYKNDFRDSGGVDSQSVQELENYADAVYKSEETTKSVNSCLRIAEDIREEATKTMILLHQQGEQITRTHMAAADIDHDLSRGEKLMGSLGGLFSRTWKPTKNRHITGPTITRDDPVRRKANHHVQKEKLGLSPVPNERPKSQTPLPESADACQRIEYEKATQDDDLDNLSNILGELKEMAIDMGSEIDGQKDALDPFADDVDELGFRVRNVNLRGRRLLGK